MFDFVAAPTAMSFMKRCSFVSPQPQSIDVDRTCLAIARSMEPPPLLSDDMSTCLPPLHALEQIYLHEDRKGAFHTHTPVLFHPFNFFWKQSCPGYSHLCRNDKQHTGSTQTEGWLLLDFKVHTRRDALAETLPVKGTKRDNGKNNQ
ncbi:unnamed protein product [Ectocarpus sp. 13 AM-2016]